jgi:phage terminase large subunit-like protein
MGKVPNHQSHYYKAYRAKQKAKEASQIALSKESIRAREDFAFFCEWVTRNAPEPCVPAEHHKEWHDILITGKTSKCLHGIAGDNLDLLAPRGSAKSTVLGLFAAWAIGTHVLSGLSLQILYLSYSLNAARAKSATIKTIIESPEYQEIFPQVKKGDRWSDQYWSIDYKAANLKSSGTERFTMVCAGLTGSITSKRVSLILIDDPIKSADQIATVNVRDKMERNWNAVIRPTLLEGGRCICLGTRFRPDDIHCTLFSPFRGWMQIEQCALIEDEEGNEHSYWEKMWSTEYLQGLRKDDPYSFSFQYQNIVRAVESLGIDPAWITYGELPDYFERYVVGIDLAASLKTKADYTAMLLLGVKGNKFYFIDYRRGKWMGNREKCDVLLSFLSEWVDEGSPVTIFIESQAYQSSFKGDFTSYIINEKKLYNLHCVPWKMKGDKLAHILSVSGSYANGGIIYNKYVFHQQSPPIVEITEFGAVAHDDCMDATVIALQAAGIRRRLEAQ